MYLLFAVPSGSSFCSRGACFACRCLAMLSLISLLATTAKSETTPSTPDLTSQPSRPVPLHQGNPGPWGHLEYERVALENFSERFPDGLKPLPPTRWMFENCNPAQLATFLGSLPLDDFSKTALLDTNRWNPLTN